MIHATVTIRSKLSVLDPEGQAVARSLQALGHSSVSNVRIGRQIELTIDHDDCELARSEVDRMCEELLVNSVIEDHELAVELIATGAPMTAGAV